MKWPTCFRLGGALLFLNQAIGADLPSKSVSTSGQFSIYCKDTRARLAVGGFVEEIKGQILSMLGLADEWKYPIVVQIAPQSGAMPAKPASDVRLYETELGFKVDIDVVLGADPSRAALRKQLVRAVLLEIAHRENPGVIHAASYAEPPQWLIEGGVAWSDPAEKQAAPETLRAILKSGKAPGLIDFLSQKSAGTDPVSQGLYRSCSFALTKLLVELPEGRLRLVKFLQNLPASDANPLESMGQHFPELAGDPKKSEKWWALNLARLSNPGGINGMGLEEAAQKLDSLLILRIPADDGLKAEEYPFGDYKVYLTRKKSREVLLSLELELMALAAKGSPLLRPIVVQYQEIAGLLAKGKTAGINKRMEQAAKERQEVGARLQGIEDYMNWFEATQMPSLSGVFKASPKGAGKAPESPNRRSDAISRYLDVLETEFEK